MSTNISADDGAAIVVPDGVDDLSDDDVETLRRDGAVVETTDGGLSVKWAFWKPQRQALEAVTSGDFDIVGFVAGYRSGKSVTGARAVWETALNPAYGRTRSLAMGVSYAEAKKTTYPVLFEQLPGGDVEDLDPFLYNGDPAQSPVVEDWNKQDGIITLVTGDVVVLASADKPTRYKGGKFSFAWCDEIAHYKPDRIHGIRKTIGERFDFGPPAVQLWTTTPNGYNPVYDVLERRVDANGDTLGSNVTVVTAESLRNPFLSPDDRSRLRRTHGNTKQADQALRGDFEAAVGRVYDDFRRSTHTVDLRRDGDEYVAVDDDRVRVSSDWRIYGYDAGFSDPRVLVEIGKTPYGQLVVVDEFYRSESHVAACVDWLRDKPRGRIYCEHEPGDIRKFRRPAITGVDDPPSGFPAGKAEKAIDAGISQVRRRLAADSDDRYGLLVANRCENLIAEFLSYTEDDVGGSNVDDHALDSLRYAVYTDSLRGSSRPGSGTRVEKR